MKTELVQPKRACSPGVPLKKVCALLLALLAALEVSAQSTAFTYQGRLDDSGGPANGSYDLRFRLFGGSNGPPVTGFRTNAATDVSNGLFTVTLDFGAGIFTGPDRWLEISVRTNGSPDSFVTLAPRQQITSTPYAVRAAAATSADTATTANAVAAANITGALTSAQLPDSVLTNGASGVTLAGAFNGDGSGLSSLSASSLTTGTVNDSRLSPNVPLLNGNNNFTGTNALADVDLRLRDITDPNHGLGYYGAIKTFPGFNQDGPVLYGYSGGALGTTVGGQQLSLVWDNSGRVGIGTNPTTSRLEVNGTLTAGNFSGDASGLTNVSVGALSQPAQVVVVWGDNYAGQTNVPADLNHVTAMAAGGAFILALKADGSVVGWGDNTYGQTSVPAGLSSVSAIAAGGYHSLALKSNGTVVAWGYGVNGQTNVPTGLSSVGAIAAGLYHSLAVKSDGTVVGWGGNSAGQTNVPAGLSSVITVAGGWYHSLALRNDGTVVGWGDNSYGQTNVPNGLNNVIAISAGSYHNLALQSDGTIVAWGDNSFGQTNLPAGLSNIIAVAAGDYHSLALQNDGTVVAWGDGGSGQTNIPVGLDGVVAVAAGGGKSLALQHRAGPAPVAVLTEDNTFQGTVTAAALAGSGAGVTNLNAASVASGTLADARLSPNVALLNGTQAFTGANSFNNAGNAFAGDGSGLTGLNASSLVTGAVPLARLPSSLVTNGGNFTGNGSGLTNLNASALSLGSLADARLSTNVALLNANQTFSGSNTFKGVALLTNANNTLTGNGAGLTSLSAANLSTGTLADARLSTNVALLNANQIFSGSNTFKGVALLTNANNTLFGNGAGLTSLNAANLSSGTLADARLSTNVALLSANLTFSGAVQFNGALSSGALAGSGAGITNLDLGQNSAGAIHPVTFMLTSQPVIPGTDPDNAVIAADVNGDGKPDLIIAGAFNSTVYIMTNNGNGGFGLSTTNFVGPQPQGVVAADVNGDGKLDFITGNNNSTYSVFTNNGSGGFAQSTTGTVNSNARSLIAVDVNGDGKPDLINADSSGGALQIFTNNGSGAFLFSINYASPGANAVAAADVNGDGKLDLITANGSSGVMVYTNNGSGAFAVSSTLTGSTPQKLIAVDVNGDGRPDIVTLTISTNRMAVYTNNGSGGFALASTPVTGGFPQALAAADFDGDGRPDLVTANGNGTDSVLINLGAGGFALRATLTVGSGPQSVATADFNADGKPDVVTGCGSTSTLFVHQNKGVEFDGTFVGNGASLTNLNASQLLSGTIADARLSSNVALLNASQTFSGSNTFSGVAALANANNTLAGNGAGITSLSAANLTGTVADARLSANVALLNASGQTFTGGTNTFAGAVHANVFRARGGSPGALGANNNGYAFIGNGGDIDSGLFSSADGQMEFYGNNTERMRITSSGNVGIGTAAPTNKLHVIGGATFSSGASGANQNVVWTPGNASWSFTSDRNTKDRVLPVDTQAVLEKVACVPIAEWSYISYDQRHIGPMAQDFHAQFPLNENDKALNDADLHGVALAAIQGLNQKLEEQRAENATLKARLDSLERLLMR